MIPVESQIGRTFAMSAVALRTWCETHSDVLGIPRAAIIVCRVFLSHRFVVDGEKRLIHTNWHALLLYATL